MRRLIILCFLFTFTAAAANDPKYISINCGGAAAATSLSGRWWSGDAAVKGSSTVATAKREVIIAVDRVPYQTARISRSQFSYSFRLNPGQKLIRLHFNPVSYEGFRSFNDLFTVEAGHFTLLANFSASITARALALDVIVKEFCIIIQENQLLYIVFSPETSQSGYNYAFINGIEIVSVPSTISYCHGGDSGIHVLGQKSVIYVDNTSVLERVYHQDVKWGYVLDDIVGMVGMWESSLKRRAKKASKVSWRVSVDVGFRYLVRIHLSKVGLKMDFAILIDDMIAFTTVDMLQQGGNKSILWYNYLVMVEGHKREGKREISISLNSQHEFLNKHGPLEGFELFKLSNHDRSLASPNPLPPRGDSASQTTQTLLHTLLGRRNVIATVVFILISLVNVIVHWLQKMWVSDEPDLTEEETKPSARAKRLCRHFSFAEIQSATENFDGALIIGKGGFGIVYRGLIDNRREIVAIKRSKPDSKQGELQFWTEVEMLSELRHVNLVTIIGYCIEQQEMIIVYEYMPYGSLADHLYKLARKSNAFYPLSWKQRLKICIGSSRALDYLHTGHGIIHRDVKASNILLDHKLVPKVSDFGLAKTGFDSESQCQDSTNLRGTFGYIDPNYFKTRKLTMKSDTYSFGVVLLEVLCGRRAVEPSEEEDKHSLTSWAIDNISKGQVDRIVAPSLRGEISTESLKTFVKVAEKCLHDEPKRRPTMAHIVIKLELALLQQEKAESFAAESTSVEDVLSSADKSQKNMHSLESNEKMNATDHLPKKENVSSSSHNEKPVSPSQMMSSFNVQADTSPLIELSKSTMINGGVKDGRKSLMRRISQKLWSQDVFRKTRKPSNKMDLVGITSVSAPVLRRTSNITLAGNTISVKRTHGEKNMSSLAPNEKMIAAEQLSEKEIMRSSSHDEKRNVTDGMPCTDNDITVLSVSPRPTLSSFNVQTDTSPPREQSNTTMINSGKNNGRKSLMHKISRKLWSQDAFWKTRNPSSKTDLVGIAASAPMLRRTSNLKMGGNTISDKRTDVMSSTPLRIFSFEELKVATRNFRGDSFLGQGGFGTVYKGWIHNKFGDKEKSRSTVAVKKLDLEGLQGFKEWQSEVEFLGRLTHPNLVKLFGYGWDDNLLFLVYEFMPKGTLESHLFRRSLQPLPWDIRLKILIGAARGLAFLHSSEKVVIHRDFKSSNILLDESYNAKISDFGLAKDGPMGDHTHVSTMVMGTYGYAAPEYVATGHLTVKSDVYGYGVVLVEVLTGLRALDVQRPAGQHNLIEWMKPHLSNWRKLKKIVDPRMEGRYPSESTVQIAKLALDCLHPNPKSRPKMQRVVETLEGLVDIFVEKPRQPRVSFSPQL